MAKHGWAHVTMGQIAAEVGVARMTLHRRGVSKPALLVTLAARLEEDYRRALWPPLTSAGSARERLTVALRAQCDVTEDNLELLEALAARDRNSVSHEAGEEALTRDVFTEPLQRLLMDGELDGTLRVGDIAETATVLFNQIGWTYQHLRVSSRLECRAHQERCRPPGRRGPEDVRSRPIGGRRPSRRALVMTEHHAPDDHDAVTLEQFTVGDAAALPVATGSFSLVTSRYSLHHVLEQEAAGPRAQGREHVLVEIECGQDHDPRRMPGVDQLPRGRDPVQRRHPHAHQHDVGRRAPGDLDHLASVSGLAHDRQAIASVDDHPKAGAHQLLVVGQQHPDRHREPSSGS